MKRRLVEVSETRRLRFVKELAVWANELPASAEIALIDMFDGETTIRWREER